MSWETFKILNDWRSVRFVFAIFKKVQIFKQQFLVLFFPNLLLLFWNTLLGNVSKGLEFKIGTLVKVFELILSSHTLIKGSSFNIESEICLKVSRRRCLKRKDRYQKQESCQFGSSLSEKCLEKSYFFPNHQKIPQLNEPIAKPVKCCSIICSKF